MKTAVKENKPVNTLSVEDLTISDCHLKKIYELAKKYNSEKRRIKKELADDFETKCDSLMDYLDKGIRSGEDFEKASEEATMAARINIYFSRHGFAAIAQSIEHVTGNYPRISNSGKPETYE